MKINSSRIRKMTILKKTQLICQKKEVSPKIKSLWIRIDWIKIIIDSSKPFSYFCGAAESCMVG
jgi:hypothetical protein